jgi:hypothetical protein
MMYSCKKCGSLVKNGSTGLCKGCVLAERNSVNDWNIGRKHSKEARERGARAKIGKKNPMWKGDSVGYTSLHEWVKRRLQKPSLCSLCMKRTDFLDLANISQKYIRNVSDWEWLCRRCHMNKDGRIKNLKQFSGESKCVPSVVETLSKKDQNYGNARSAEDYSGGVFVGCFHT